MVAPLPKMGLLSIDLGTLPKDVQEIKQTLDLAQPGIARALSTNVAAIQAQLDPQQQGLGRTVDTLAKHVTDVQAKVNSIEKEFDAKKPGTLAHVVHSISSDSDELILRHLVTSKLAETSDEARFIDDILKAKYNSDPHQILRAKEFPQALKAEYNKPSTSHKVPSDTKINDFLEVIGKVFKR